MRGRETRRMETQPGETACARRMRLDRERRKAYNVLWNEIRRGRLVRPDTCSKCGGSSARIEAHHRDHSKPLDVDWLCSVCHGAIRRIKDSYVF